MCLFTWKQAADVSVIKKDSCALMIKGWPISVLNTLCKVRFSAFILNLGFVWICQIRVKPVFNCLLKAVIPTAVTAS
jgi:hypothetical protein